MGWGEVRDTVQQGMVIASGLPADRVLWKFQDADAPSGTYIAISFSSVMDVGMDYVEPTTDLSRPAGQEVAHTVRGMREVALDVSCFTPSTADANDALALAERTRSGLKLPTARNLLASVGFAPFDMGRVGYLPEVVSVGFRGRATFTARCYMPAQAVVEYAGFIASVTGTVTSSSVPGATDEDVRDFSVP